MNVFFHDAKSEVNFLLGYTGHIVQITPGDKSGTPFDAVIDDANTGGGDGVALVYLPYDEDTGRAVEGAESESINTDDIFELEIY